MTKPFGFDQIGFQIVWLISAIGAARGLAWPGIFASGLLLFLHLGWSTQRRADALIVLAAGATGCVAETALVAGGAIRYSAAWPSTAFAPAWIISLWLAFAVIIEPLRRLLGSRPLVKSAVLGAAFGPLSYIAAERMGAASLPSGPMLWTAYVAFAVVWAVALPTLMIAQRSEAL